MLLRIESAIPEEIQSGVYNWNNRNRNARTIVVLQLTLAGSCTFQWDQNRAEVDAGKAMFFSFNENSSYYREDPSAPPYHNSWISFSGPTAIDIHRAVWEKAGPILPLQQMPRTLENYQNLLTSYKKGIWANQWRQATDAFRFGIVMLEELDAMFQPKDPIERCRQRIAQDYRDPFTVAEIAAQENITAEHLTREYKKRTGSTPALDLRKNRLSHARSLLRSHAIPEIDAARFAGFRDVRSLRSLLRKEADDT
tara:strand:- start:3846 stop:4604 length:759 start_codon:yes stop_codon:yes gene_type:complete